LKVNWAPPDEGGAGDLTNDQVAAPVVAPPVVEESDVEPVAPAEPVAQVVPMDIFKRRVDTLSRQKAAAEARQAELEAQLAQVSSGQQPQVVAQPKGSVQEEAEFLARQMRLNEKSNDIAAEGQSIAPDFMLRVNNLNSTLGTLTPQFLEALSDAGGDAKTSAEILYALGGDIAKAGTIMAMSPTKQAIALAKLAGELEVKKEAKKTPPPARGNAPTPITPKIGGGRSPADQVVDLADSKTPIDDWMAQRDAAAKGRRR
jgi:hypothetical protein